MPSDVGGAITIEDGTGPIRTILSTGDALYVYKQDKTFRIDTPETIDPERTNPNAPFVVSAVEEVGTANWVVARVLLFAPQMPAGNDAKTTRCRTLWLAGFLLDQFRIQADHSAESPYRPSAPPGCHTTACPSQIPS